MAATNFNTANQTFRQLMGNGLIYSVPRFQRDYSWTETEWDDLWQDIQGILEPDGEPAHYMGYLVLQSRDSKNFEIIDGQQRLATLSIIILAVLANIQKLIDKNIAPEDNKRRQDQLRNSFIGYLDPVTLIPKSKLTLNKNNNHLYQNYLVTLLPAPKRNLKATEHLMRKSFDWFSDKISETQRVQEGAEFAKFVESIADKLFFTVITVTDELNAYKVFETLNARGVKLSSTDLLKNYLFSVVHSESKDDLELHQLESRWEVLVNKLGSESFPDFLRTHWNSRNRFVRHSELFKTTRDSIENREQVFRLLREMEKDADPYVALSSPEDSLWAHDQREFIRELSMFSVRQLYPLLLAAYRDFTQSEFKDLLRACSIISFRYNVIGGLATNEQERIYNSVAQRISRGDLKSFSQTILELRPIYLNDEQFAAAFSEKYLKTTWPRNRRVVRYILFSIEKHVSGHDFDFDSDAYNVEHILPENPADGWEHVSETEVEQFVYRLGNMTPLKTGENRDVGNESFQVKKPILEKSEFQITAKVAEDNSEWNPERIGARQRWLATQAKSIWRISQLS